MTLATSSPVTSSIIVGRRLPMVRGAIRFELPPRALPSNESWYAAEFIGHRFKRTLIDPNDRMSTASAQRVEYRQSLILFRLAAQMPCQQIRRLQWEHLLVITEYWGTSKQGFNVWQLQCSNIIHKNIRTSVSVPYRSSNTKSTGRSMFCS